ncbi:ATP-binding protein [Camelimonas abortus]|uniref:histidine kinase n=1 Tax=Camelimonas abortus TaxID=1017184 RepID=A0ABV7LAJ3_9HYPH
MLQDGGGAGAARATQIADMTGLSPAGAAAGSAVSAPGRHVAGPSAGRQARLRYSSATRERRRYNRWVADETMEDFALRFTARRARRWSARRVAVTAFGSVSFLALEAIGAALTLACGAMVAVSAILTVSVILFVLGLPVCRAAARAGVDVDLLTRGAGCGYLGSTMTSLVYAGFTFIFFMLESAILAEALRLFFGVPVWAGFLAGVLVIFPIVAGGVSRISAFQARTLWPWLILHLAPFAAVLWAGLQPDRAEWLGWPARDQGASPVALFGAACGVLFALVGQIGEQVDYLRFLPEPRNACERRRWWAALLGAGPGWIIPGAVKLLLGSLLAVMTVRMTGVATADPSALYHVAFMALPAPAGAVALLTVSFVALSQIRINVTNAYAGSITWSNFFARLTRSHPGRVVWLVFNVAIAFILMWAGVQETLERALLIYAHFALAWIGAVFADLAVNRPLKLAPPGIEFRRGYLYDVNPVGVGAMAAAGVAALVAASGLAGEMARAFSSFITLGAAIIAAPLIAWATRGRFYLVRRPEPESAAEAACFVCDYVFDREDLVHCPFYRGPVCSLCCSLDAACHDSCRRGARVGAQTERLLRRLLPAPAFQMARSLVGRFLIFTAIAAAVMAALTAALVEAAGSPDFSRVAVMAFCLALICAGVGIWLLLLTNDNHMKAVAEMRSQSARLLREIRAHRRTDAALREARERAEAASQAKSRYMAGMSHELRTPLNAIYGFAQVLERSSQLPPDSQAAVRAIRSSSEHLAGLIEGLLDISKIEAGKLTLNVDLVDINAFLDQIRRIFTASAAEKGIRFAVVTETPLPQLARTDEKRLRQILINLCSNAVAYTSEGSVTLSVRYRNEVARFEVADTGPGIPLAEQAKIWDPFHRGVAARARHPGSGLGLTITRLLVDVMGGEITLDSAPGRGSRFVVRLMLPAEASAARDETTVAAAAVQPGAPAEGAPVEVLAVDDDPAQLALMRSHLEPLGFRVLTAGSAEEGLALLAGAQPRLFLLDIDLPGMDGFEMARRLRGLGYAGAPVLFITGHAREADPDREGDGHAPEGFLVKPFRLDDLTARIARLLSPEETGERHDAHATPAPAPGPEAAGQDRTGARRGAGRGGAASVRELLRLAEEGRATALRRALAHPPAWLDRASLDRIHAALDVFDLPAIARLLRERRHESAGPDRSRR